MTTLLQGAQLKGPKHDGRWQLVKRGFVAPEYLTEIPGVQKTVSGKIFVPSNCLPKRPDPPLPLDYPALTPETCLALRPYQMEAINFILNRPKGALVCLDVGLGKTFVALHSVVTSGSLPFLVIGPKISATTWCDEDGDPTKHYGLKMVRLTGRKPLTEIPPADGYFINPEILPYWHKRLMGHAFEHKESNKEPVLRLAEALPIRSVIIDEAHIFRNVVSHKEGQRKPAWLCVMELTGRRHIKQRILLTATPIVKGVIDLWNLLNFSEPWQWGKRSAGFGVRYAGYIQDEYGWKATGETNTEELRNRLSRTMFVRARRDVRDDLPRLERRRVEVPDDLLGKVAWGAYKHAFRNMRAKLQAEGKSVKGEKLQQYNELRRRLSQAKQPAAEAEIREMLHRHKKVLVLTWYKETAQRLKDNLARDAACYGVITSEMTDKNRAKLLAGLAAEKEKALCFATIGTVQMSLNKLICCSGLCVVDLYWTPNIFLQAEGRIDREGQRASSIEMAYILKKGSIDDIMYERIQQRAQCALALGESEAGVSLTESLGAPAEENAFEAFAQAVAECDDWED